MYLAIVTFTFAKKRRDWQHKEHLCPNKSGRVPWGVWLVPMEAVSTLNELIKGVPDMSRKHVAWLQQQPTVTEGCRACFQRVHKSALKGGKGILQMLKDKSL